MTDKLPSLMDVINPDNQKTEQTQNLNEINSEKPKEENQQNSIKTEMCQLIYYDFSLK